MKFAVEDMKGAIYNIEASSKSKIAKIKQILELRTGLSANSIELVAPGQKLADSYTLQFYQIRENQKIFFIINHPRQINLVITGEDIEPITMEIDVLARIQNLKERIFKLTGFPTQLFQLKCNGAVLETSMTIARYKLNEKSQIQINLTQRPNCVTIRNLTTDDIFQMQMFPTDTIAQTKLRLSQITGFNPTQIKLRNDEEELLDYNQIQQYNINNEIYLSIVNLEGIIIHVKTIPFGKKISLVLDPSESISQVKALIQDQMNIPEDVQTLVHGGQIIEDNSRLEQLSLTDETVLYLVLPPTIQ